MATATDGAGNGGIRALIVGPDIRGVSGEPTHIRTLLSSPLSRAFRLFYYRVGGGERRVRPENPVARNLVRVLAPAGFPFELMFVRPSLVHINNSFNFKGLLRDCSLALTAKATGRKVVFEMHGGEPEEWLSRHRMMKPLVLRALRSVDRVVYLSREQEEFLGKYLSPQRFVLIPNMVNPQEFTPGTPAEPPTFLYMGRLLGSKGLFDLIEAFSGFDPETRLEIAGDGPARAEIAKRIAKNRLGDRVKLLGFVVGEEKKKTLSRAYALVLPSYHEGIPYVVLEAMASGLPIVATAVGGIPDVVRDGTDGILVKPCRPDDLREAMRTLLDRKRRDEMARSARARSGNFSVEKVGQTYIELYRSVLGKS